jgi:LPXTG-site transpeptidase (sortase) family protein
MADKQAKDTIQRIYQAKEVDTKVEGITLMDVELAGYKVVGIIKIPSIDIEYPILQPEEPTDTVALNTSIIQFWGNEINSVGNVTLAGHNMKNGTMFGKNAQLEEGDIIELTDEQNVTLQYKVFQKYIIEPNDVSCLLPVNPHEREVTLITCTNGRKNRLIVKAVEI